MADGLPRGLRTLIYPAPDLPTAKASYERLLGKFELGLDPDLSARGPGDAGGPAYRGVARAWTARSGTRRPVARRSTRPPGTWAKGSGWPRSAIPFGNPHSASRADPLLGPTTDTGAC